ncbi:MAG TPA: hypothetical protein VFT64_03150 [Rickettsiales bacterium]|nr:hypothetical protein [Rickettsiales bacterium]
MQVIFTEITPFQLDECNAPMLIGTHHGNDAVRLYRLAGEGYVVVNPAFDPAKRPPCRGVMVDNNIRFVIEEAYGQPDLRVYYPGVTGPLMLNLPAVQNRANEWFYYIAENQRDAFFAFDFKRVRPVAEGKRRGG